MNFLEHKTALLAWYVSLWLDPAWKGHAWHQVQELARKWPALYGDLPALVAEAARARSTGD